MNALIIKLKLTDLNLLLKHEQANFNVKCVITINTYKTRVIKFIKKLIHLLKSKF